MYQDYTEILVKKQGKVLIITFNNPKKKNCLNRKGYTEIGRILREVANDETVTIVVFTGAGDFFTAGNDLSQTTDNEDFETSKKEASIVLNEMISAIVDCPKVLVALINGPAIGIGSTLAGLCDLVWCSETAYFLTPFTQLGLVPEGCSSYLFPLILGRSKATEMLLFSEKMSADEAYHYNFVSKIFKISDLNTIIWPKLHEFSKLPPQSMQISKNLIRLHEKEALYKALNSEGEELYERVGSEEFMMALMEFATRKNKSKL